MQFNKSIGDWIPRVKWNALIAGNAPESGKTGSGGLKDELRIMRNVRNRIAVFEFEIWVFSELAMAFPNLCG